MYQVFIRNWWRKDAKEKLVPNSGGRKTHYCYAKTEDEAGDVCKVYNVNHAPGKLSRKAEYTGA